MTAFLLQYLPIVIFLGIAAALGTIFILFPWAVALMKLPAAAGQFTFWSMMRFLGVLTVGYIYEWKKGPWNGSDRSRRRRRPYPPSCRGRGRPLGRRGL